MHFGLHGPGTEQLILVNAERLSTSSQWTDRYLACQAFKLAISPQHESIITALIHDPVLIIALHAALVAVSYDSVPLINHVIDVFAQNRHVQQSLFAQLMTKTHPHFVRLVSERLSREQDPYIKAFCYRMLSANEHQGDALEQAFNDAKRLPLELRLAAMHYLHAHSSARVNQLFLTCLTDPHWEIRAKAAKLLGKSENAQFAPALTRCLHDEVWWVRISATEALAALGVEDFT